MPYKWIGLALAGAAGALARYGLAGLVQRLHITSFPWGTFVVNALGCFVFGLVWAYAQDRVWIGPELRTVILVGFLGAFTTFSTFMFETDQLLESAQWLTAAFNVFGQVAAGLGAYVLGAALGRLI